jgi:abscisic acid receptor (PYR/PYL family)
MREVCATGEMGGDTLSVLERELEKLDEVDRDLVRKHHNQMIHANQCGSTFFQEINAPVDVVWGIVRQFDRPQSYKHFLQSCSLVKGDGRPGSVREVRCRSGLPGTNSIERLQVLDDKNHISSFTIVGGCHRLKNYWSVTSLHERIINGRRGTLAMESYVADVPEGNTTADTCMFVNTVIKCNLKSLQTVAEAAFAESERNGLPYREDM